MRLRDRLKYRLFLPVFSARRQNELKWQYIQWQEMGYSRIVQLQMICLLVIFVLIDTIVPASHHTRAESLVHYISGMPPSLYQHYKSRYLQFWDPMYPHVRLLLHCGPRLIPKSERHRVINRYRIWKEESSKSPLAALNAILDQIESRHVNSHWMINVRNIIEFTIWIGGRVEKPFHQRKYGQWKLKDFPDTKCGDPTRYALAASIMEQLVDVFNWRMSLGMSRDYVQIGLENRVGKRWDLDYPSPTPESVPEWTKHVPAAPTSIIIHSAYAKPGMSFEQALAAHGNTDPPNYHFLKRGLLADKHILEFV